MKTNHTEFRLPAIDGTTVKSNRRSILECRLLRLGGRICPDCESKRLSFGTPVHLSTKIYHQTVSCRNCELGWEAVHVRPIESQPYRLVAAKNFLNLNPYGGIIVPRRENDDSPGFSQRKTTLKDRVFPRKVTEEWPSPDGVLPEIFRKEWSF